MTQADVDELVNVVKLPRLKERKPDQALLDGLRLGERKFQVFRTTVPVSRSAAAGPAAASPAEPGGLLGRGSWLWVVVILVGAWVGSPARPKPTGSR